MRREGDTGIAKLRVSVQRNVPKDESVSMLTNPLIQQLKHDCILATNCTFCMHHIHTLLFFECATFAF